MGAGGGDVFDPPPPKRTCIPPPANLASTVVRTLHVPKIPANINVRLNDVCVLPAIKLVSAKNMCLSSPQSNTITSCSRTLRGDRSARLVTQNSPFTHPSLKEKAGEIVGVGNHLVTQSMNAFVPCRAVQHSSQGTNPRQNFLFNQQSTVPLSMHALVPCRAAQRSSLGTNPRHFPLLASRGRQSAATNKGRGFPLVSPTTNSRLSAPMRAVTDTYSCRGFPIASPPPRSPLLLEAEPSETIMTHASYRLDKPVGSHLSIKRMRELPSRARSAATRVICKYKRNDNNVTARRGTFVSPAVTMTSAAPTHGALPSTRVSVTSAVSPRPSNPLGRHLQRWKACKPSAWILRILTHGYRLQFARRPPLTHSAVFTHAQGQSLATLKVEIQTLLQKGAIQEVNLGKNPAGFYSKYFLVTKKGGGLRPILDLRGLNGFLKRLSFKMLTTTTLLRRIRRGAWFCTVDLRDAFFHVSIYPPHRKFLRFGLDGVVYQYTVLPFGMALSPRVFTKCTQAAIAPLRAQGIRLDAYLDDWLISADTREEAIRHTEVVVSHLTSLGFMVNWEKSTLVPSQQTTFLGIMLDSTTLGARLSQDRIDTFLACARTLRLGAWVPYKTCMRLTGFMASTIHLVRLGRFYMRPFQRWVLSLRIPPSQGSRMVRVSQTCVSALEPWLRTAFLSRGVKMGLILSVKFVTTDASLVGWGAVHNGMTAKGVWSVALRTRHINYLELMAVFLALKRFEPFLRDSHVHVRTDNTAALCYINKQGGLASPALDRLARELTLWCDLRLKSIRASHVAGLQNSGADLLSRGKYYYADWSLHPGVARQIFARYGCPDVDLFASEKNAKCPRFFSIQGAAPLGLEAFAHDWPRERLYAFPPLQLIHPTLERVRLQGLSLLLVAPGWGSWRSEIAPLLYDVPWRLPPLRDLVSQADGDILHPRPADLDLWVWPVSGSAWLPAV